MDIIFTVGLARARNVRALPSTCRATGTIFSRDIHSTTVYRGGSYRHRGHPRHDCVDQGIWKISRPTSPHPHSCNRACDSVPVPSNSGAGSSTFWSALSAPGTTNRPDPKNRPNGTNVAPSDAGLEAANAYYSVETVHQYHHHPHRYPMRQSGLTKVGVKSRVWSIHELSQRVFYKHIPIAGGQDLHKPRMLYLLPLPLILTHGPPHIKYSGGLH